AYDVVVASWMGTVLADTTDGTCFPAFTGATWARANGLRYGENPHQAAALYRHWRAPGSGGLAQAEQLHGKEMSYNNYVDTDAAWRAAHDHTAPCVAIIKHANPCGIAVGADLAEAYQRAFACDPVSAYGGVVAANGVVTLAMAEQAADVFTEVVAAPDFAPQALEVLRRKKNVRLLRVPSGVTDPVEFRPISGGVLAQTVDRLDAVVPGTGDGDPGGGDDPARWRLVTGEPADQGTLRDLAFAWRAVRAVKSNAVLLAKGGASVGIGMGQVNRVDSCRLAIARAGEERARGAVAASDAFFPFPDGLEVLLEAGVRAVVQPGGSRRDDEVIAAARAAGATMYLTGVRHFAH
ncbi:MAG: bifunctional phosphoribosylaminoimidazolecarboxamide formyltransferase/IMP cyclohydrolase, partial [Kineosporiaceae bacterium]